MDNSLWSVIAAWAAVAVAIWQAARATRAARHAAIDSAAFSRQQEHWIAARRYLIELSQLATHWWAEWAQETRYREVARSVYERRQGNDDVYQEMANTAKLIEKSLRDAWIHLSDETAGSLTAIWGKNRTWLPLREGSQASADVWINTADEFLKAVNNCLREAEMDGKSAEWLRLKRHPDLNCANLK